MTSLALVVGASSGIGRATAVRLARDGWSVIAAARRRERLEQLASEQPGIVPFPTDVTQPADCAALIAFACEHRQRQDSLASAAGDDHTTSPPLRRIDAVIYATGTNFPERSLTRLTADRWTEGLTINLTGALHITQAVLPEFRRQRGGLLVYVASAAVQRGDASGVAYQASKHGLVGLAQGTRFEAKADGVRTTVVFPGLCETDILQQRPEPTPADQLRLALQPEDVAAAIALVCGLPERTYIPELPIVPAGLW